MQERWSIPRWAPWRPRTAEGPGHTTAQRSEKAGNRTDCASTARGRAACGKQCLGPNQWGGRKVSPGTSEVEIPRSPARFAESGGSVGRERGPARGSPVTPPGARPAPLRDAPRDSFTRALQQGLGAAGQLHSKLRPSHPMNQVSALRWSGAFSCSHRRGWRAFTAFLTHQSAAFRKFEDCNSYSCLLGDPQNLLRQTSSPPPFPPDSLSSQSPGSPTPSVSCLPSLMPHTSKNSRRP